ncbi:MAG TPA: threonine synthase [Tepidisphaeraceae bacterium]|jgi:threonine synthase|nr:threonine synthase [Tepidisphaeraceae bacterium]
MNYVLGLKCKECGHRVPATPVHVCEQCFGPYEVEYDYEAMKGKVTRESIAAGPKSLWRYKDLLPVTKPVTGKHSGMTPLKRAGRLAAELGCKELWIKDDSCNYPTYSYKERVVSVAISKAVEFGFDTVGCASTGNLANSTAAHAAEAGIRCFVMIPHDLELGKVLGSLVFGPTMVRIRGNYDDVNRLCTEIADKYGWAIVNVNLRPYYTEGAKTYGFEIAEQLGWRLPQHTVVPTAGGTILPKIYKAYQEFIKLGIVEDTGSKIYSAQAAGCNPVVTAIQKGVDIIEPQKPNTIAKSIAIGNPADGYYAAQVVRDSGGWGESATDREIVDAIKLLARTEGIWTEPAGGTTLAVAMKLIQSGRIPKDESIVVSITGNGLKTVEVVQNELITPTVIEPKLSEFDKMFEETQAASKEKPRKPELVGA